MTSCSDDDDSASQEYQKKLIGEWLATVNRDTELDDENDVVYVLLAFGEDGVLFQKNYDGNTTEPLNCWERSCRHGIYTVNEAAHTIQCELFEGEAKFGFAGDQMIFTDSSNDVEMSMTFHRPSKAEKALLSMYDLSLEGNDYCGKWFMVQEENGKSTYTMLDFTEDSGLKTTRYTVTGDQCIRTDYSQFYGEDNSDEDGPMLEIYNSNDYFQRELYWWKVSGNTLTLEKNDDSEEETILTYHALTKADAALLAELEKKCPLIDNLTEKIKGKWMMAEVNGKPVVTNSKQVLTYETATKFYYSLSISAISDLNVWVNHCEGRYNANGTTLVQLVKLPNEDIKFSQQFNILSVTDDEMQVYAMSETFINDQSYRLTKDLRERKVRVKHDYSNDIIGTWEGRLTSGVSIVEQSGIAEGARYITDGMRVQQILINFLTNAIKHTASGEIVIASSLVENPGFITFSVADTGPGVPPDKADSIFERFVKLDSSKQGTGLGLSICRMMASSLGGKVWLDTQYTDGARFMLTIPKEEA